MDEQFADRLFGAIQNDDVKAFSGFTEINCGAYRFGRFPVLSALYFYHAKKILKKYEEKYVKIDSWQELKEPPALAAEFRKAAGKCMRIYLEETVSPLEMLLLLDETKRLKKIYPETKPSAAVKQRLRDIYAIRYALSVEFGENGIELERRPRTRREKRRIAIVCVSAALGVTLLTSVPFVVNAFVPFINVDDPTVKNYYTVSKLKDINFESVNTYTLERDITIPADFYAKELRCDIEGNGKTLTVSHTAFGMLTGSVKNVTFVTDGSAPVMTAVYLGATVEDVSLNVAADTETESGLGFLVSENYGTINRVSLNVSGKVRFRAPEGTGEGGEGAAEPTAYYFGGIVEHNGRIESLMNTYYGVIRDCTAVYTDLTLTGEWKADASFGGIAGINYGYVSGCTAEGKIDADTFDLAGICGTNRHVLIESRNKASLHQSAENEKWSPLAAGIAVMNYGSVQACVNEGALSAQGAKAAYVGGIAGRAYNEAVKCISSGTLSAKAETCFVGGIAACSDLTLLQGSFGRYIYSGTADRCIAECNISAEGEELLVGGIFGFVNELYFSNLLDGARYLGGAVHDSYFTGSFESVAEAGAIVGVLGKNLHDGNANTTLGANFSNLKGNYFAGDGLAVGRLFVWEEKEEGDESEQKRIYSEGSSLGAAASTKEEIGAMQGYREIKGEAPSEDGDGKGDGETV